MKRTALIATLFALAVPAAVVAPAVAHVGSYAQVAHASSDAGDMRKANAVVDLMAPRVIRKFCSLIKAGEEGGFSHEEMYRQFRHGYGRAQHPNARQVFIVLLGRC